MQINSFLIRMQEALPLMLSREFRRKLCRNKTFFTENPALNKREEAIKRSWCFFP
jgi:hypothetical protein